MYSIENGIFKKKNKKVFLIPYSLFKGAGMWIFVSVGESQVSSLAAFSCFKPLSYAKLR